MNRRTSEENTVRQRERVVGCAHQRQRERMKKSGLAYTGASAKSEHKCKRVMKGTRGRRPFVSLSSMVVSALLFFLLFPSSISRPWIIIRCMSAASNIPRFCCTYPARSHPSTAAPATGASCSRCHYFTFHYQSKLIVFIPLNIRH